MRIGVDARELTGQPTGVGRYLRGLLSSWADDERARAHEFVLYAPEAIGMAIDGHRFPTRIVPGTAGTAWEQLRLPAFAGRDHLDVLFSPAYTAPLFRRLPIVAAVHDISFTARPEWFSPREGFRRRWFTRQAARQARAVITISEFSRREIVEHYRIPVEKVHVVPPGIDAPGGQRGGGPLADEPKGRDSAVGPAAVRPARVLYVGSIFNRRHVPDLLRAFAPIARAHPEASLDLVGGNRSYPRQDIAAAIAALAMDGRVRWRQYVSEEDLSALYACARAFAFLSEYEGLGLTPLEALAAGVPGVLLDTPVARESCGDAALYVPRGDVAATTHALEQLLFDEAVRARILAAAPGVLGRYDWRRAARDTLGVIEGAV